MSWRGLCNRIGVTATRAQVIAITYLERHGFVFAKDFGYLNARNLARQHRRQNRKNRKGVAS